MRKWISGLVLMAAIAPSIARGQSAAMGTVGKPAPTSGEQVCGRDASGVLACFTFRASDGAVLIGTPVPASVSSVKIAVTTTATALPAQVTVNGTVVKAGSNSTYNDGSSAIVWVGGSDMTCSAGVVTKGYPLAPGEAFSAATSDRSAIYVCTASGTAVAYATGN